MVGRALGIHSLTSQLPPGRVVRRVQPVRGSFPDPQERKLIGDAGATGEPERPRGTGSEGSRRKELEDSWTAWFVIGETRNAGYRLAVGTDCLVLRKK